MNFAEKWIELEKIILSDPDPEMQRSYCSFSGGSYEPNFQT